MMPFIASFCSRFIFLAFLMFGIFACTTKPANQSSGAISASEYQRVVEKNSTHAQQYNGLYNVLDVTGTLRNSSVLGAQTRNTARMSQWDDEHLQKELAQNEQNLSQKTQVFVSFFTPERVNDNLHKPHSTWKIYLRNSQRRWEGTVTKLKDSLVDIQGMYPYHNRFSTPYLMTFPVPMKEIEKSDLSVTITGPVGTVELNFSPLE